MGCMVLSSNRASQIEFPPPSLSGPASHIPLSHDLVPEDVPRM